MANTTTVSGSIIEIVMNDEDWAWNSSATGGGLPDAGMRAGEGIYIHSIEFFPSATDDRLVITEGAIDGPAICDLLCPSATQEPKNVELDPTKQYKPYIDVSGGDCVFDSSSHKIIIRMI